MPSIAVFTKHYSSNIGHSLLLFVQLSFLIFLLTFLLKKEKATFIAVAIVWSAITRWETKYVEKKNLKEFNKKLSKEVKSDNIYNFIKSDSWKSDRFMGRYREESTIANAILEKWTNWH